MQEVGQMKDENNGTTYEDTGLTPEEVAALVKDWSDLCTIVGECGGIYAEHPPQVGGEDRQR